MAEDSHSGDPPQQGSVFGNLPDTRPGTRSPRRGAGKDSDASSEAPQARPAKAAEPAKPQAKPDTSTRVPPKQPAGAPQPPPPGSRAQGIGGVEDLAWAGVAAAAEAATLGVRLASRALDALRGNPERD